MATTLVPGTMVSFSTVGISGNNTYLGLETAQASAPATPTAGFRLYADATHRLSWKGQNGFVRTFDGVANTADRTYTLPNASGTVGLLEVANTWTGAQAISNTTASTSTTTGALTVAGGAGFAGDINLGGYIRIRENSTAEISAQPGLVTGGQASSLSVGARRYDANGQRLVAYIDFRGVDGSGNQTNGAMDFYLRPNSAGGAEAAENVATWTAGNSPLGGTLSLLQTTASTSSTTGALTVAGGLGVAGAGFFGGSISGLSSTANVQIIADRNSTLSANASGGTLSLRGGNSTVSTAAVEYGRVQGIAVGVTAGSETGGVQLVGRDSAGAFATLLRADYSGTTARIGAFGVTPVARQSVGAAATDAATTQTLANNLRTALINLGFCQN